MKSFTCCALFGFITGFALSDAIPALADSCVDGCAESTHWFFEFDNGTTWCVITNVANAHYGRVRSAAGTPNQIGTIDADVCDDTDCARWCYVVLETKIESTGGSPHMGCFELEDMNLNECQI